MSDEEKDKRKLATNRLLDLLRAQQAAEKEEVDKVERAEQPESEDGSSEAEEMVQEAAEREEGERDEVEEEPDREDGTVGAAEAEPELIGLPAEELEQPEPGGLLGQIQAPQPEDREEEEPEIEPEEFDTSLYSAATERREKRGALTVLSPLYQILNESRTKVTIHCGEQIMRFVELKTVSGRSQITKFNSYSLPYKTENGSITKMDELLTHVLDREIDSKEKKRVYGAYYSSRTPTKTQILQTPELKRKELSQLIEWSAKKNLPFNADGAVISWQISRPEGDTLKRNVVMGIGEKTSIERAITFFGESSVKLRLFSTLPILLWKSFNRNYPDRETGCYLIVHIGENRTNLAVIQEKKLLFAREIAIGLRDFEKAIIQKFAVGDRFVEIDKERAGNILRDYGVPRKTSGVMAGSRISLYKISVFLRPVLERMTTELNRSLAYFKKENPELEFNELMFGGIGATIPHLVEALGENLDRKVSLFNPVRSGDYLFPDGSAIPDSALPNFAVNLALGLQDVEPLNVLPPKVRSNHRYIFLQKLSLGMVAFLIPLFVVTTFFAGRKVDTLRAKIADRKEQISNISVEARGYREMLNDIEILNGFQRFLSNDRTFSRNQITLLKVLSGTVTENIKFTSLAFTRMVDKNTGEESGEYKEMLKIKGFVRADPSVADIHLTNFVIKLEELNMFKNVDLQMDQTKSPEEGKLFFFLNLKF